jgi:hypothetical protein
MPSMLEHPSHSIAKVLCPADSGAGKTGALASLVDAGLNVRALDFDAGLSVLKGYVKNKANLANVHYVDQLQDDMFLVAGRVGIRKSAAFQRAMDALDKGGPAFWGGDVPPLKNWTSRDVLVVDALSTAGRASLQMVMVANGAAQKAPEIQHYGTAMDNIEKWLQMITGDSIKCHVIVNTHITSLEGTAKLYPEALGSKLSPKVGRYFDNTITLGIRNNARVFITDKDGMFPCKSAVPLNATYPIATGWKDIFEALIGKPLSELTK